MSNGPLSRHRFQIWNGNQHPYKHTLNEFAYSNPALPGITNLEATIDWMLAVFYPNTQPSVANPAALPLVGNTINDYRVVLDDGDGKAASYRWQQLEGEASPSWHKVYDMDWGQDSILANFLDVTQDLYMYKQGKTDIDGSGSPIVGTLAGQQVYGGNTANQNLTLHANSGDGVGPTTGFVQFADDVRPTVDNAFDLGTLANRFLNLYLASQAVVSTMTIAGGSITDSTGAISFGNENLTTTGDVTADTVTATDAAIGSLNFSTNVVTSDTNIISMLAQTVEDLANLITDQLTVGNGADTLVVTTNAVRTLYNSSSGVHNFNGQDLSNIDSLSANSFDLTSADIGDFTISGDTITNTDPVTFAAPSVGFQDISATDIAADTVDASVSGEFGNYNFGATDATTVGANSNFNINANGTGKIVTKKALEPNVDNTDDLGATAKRYQDLYLSGTINDGTNSISMATLQSFRDALVGATTGDALFYNSVSGKWEASNPDTEILHNELGNLTTGDAGHTQFAMLAGRAGGQTLQGGTAATEHLVLESTSNASKGEVKVKDVLTPFTNAAVDIGTSALKWRDLYSAGQNFGLRLENTATDNNFSVSSVGRQYYETDNGLPYTDTGSSSKYAYYIQEYSYNGSGSSVTIPHDLRTVINLTNASLVSIANISIQADIVGNRVKTLVNKTGVTVTLINSASLLTGTGANFDLLNNQSVTLVYSGTEWCLQGAASSGASTSTDSLLIENLGITTSVGSNALTINITQGSGATPSTGAAAVKVAFRSTPVTSGLYNIRSITSSLSFTVSSGSTLGHLSGSEHDIYVYLLDNSGTVELAVSQILFDDAGLVTTVAEGGAGAADTNNVMYSATARTNVPFRLVGKMISVQTTAGTWATVPSQVFVGDYGKLAVTDLVYADYSTAAGQSIPNNTTTVVNFGTRVRDSKGCVNTGASWTFTVPQSGVYEIQSSLMYTNVAWTAGNTIFYNVYVNGTFVRNLYYNVIQASYTDFTTALSGSVKYILVAGDTISIRTFQNRGSSTALHADDKYCYVTIEKVG